MLCVKVLIKTLLLSIICQSLSDSQSNEYPEKPLNSTPTYNFVATQADTLLSSQQPGYSITQPAGYKNNNPRPRRQSPPEQPATPDTLNSEALQTTARKIRAEDKQDKPFLSVNNNFRILHMKTGPLPNNKMPEEYPNHKKKLIEPSVEDQQCHKIKQQPPLRISKPTSTTTMDSHEIRYLHDIFLNYPKSHHVNFGHVELSPDLFEKRFESQKATNRYRGEIMWLDDTGGFVQHSWNMAQGRL